MILPLLLALLSPGDVDAASVRTGTIQGVVVNGSRGREPIANVDVWLRGGPDGVLEPVARTQTDLYGKFVFDDVPLDPAIVYLPGADRDGVHYPGERARIDPDHRFAHVTIVAFDAVTAPSPLVARRHAIDVNIGKELMEISETLLISNPSQSTYVGEQVGDSPLVTLRLSVPPNFDRITFGNEFYGRRFRIVDHQPVTDIPWPPGERELKFSYRIPLGESGGVLRRPLDMPCRSATLRVRGKNAEEISCNLGSAKRSGNDTVFASTDKELPAGHVIELQIDAVPFPWVECTRWGSLVALAALMLATVVLLRRHS